jgi:hypothetical protein
MSLNALGRQKTGHLHLRVYRERLDPCDQAVVKAVHSQVRRLDCGANERCISSQTGKKCGGVGVLTYLLLGLGSLDRVGAKITRQCGPSSVFFVQGRYHT